ncbi:MAG: MFS transporter, partial [Planctomycetota bacterium]
MSPGAPGGAGLLRRARRNFAYLTAFCMDLSLGAGLIAFNYMAKEEYGATPGQLGLIALISAGVYFGASLVLGRLSDHWGRRPSIVIGCLVGAAAFALGSRAAKLWHVYALMGLSALAMASFWPALEADISDNSTPRELPRRVGRFNVAWCGGFAVTGLTAGSLCQLVGHRWVLLLVACVGLLTILIYLARTFESEGEVPGEPEECLARRSPARASAFWRMALVLNFAAMGANSVLRYHVPTVTGGDRPALGGGYLTVLFAAETLTFIVLGLWHGWHYRGWPLVASCFLIVSGGVLCGLFHQMIPVFAAGCALTGIGCGLVYNSSIYYSVAAESGRGRRGGIHESALGLGAAVVPYVGGALAMTPWLAAGPGLQKGTPFFTGAGFMLLACGVALVIATRGLRT